MERDNPQKLLPSASLDRETRSLCKRQYTDLVEEMPRGNGGSSKANYSNDEVAEVGYRKEENDSHQGREEKDDGVLPYQSGEGLPYAPINWPNSGDNWSWRVGKRFNNSYHFVDRCLYPPKRLRSTSNGSWRFDSKAGITKYVLSVFPNADIDAFFASFTWKIPVSTQFMRKVEGYEEENQVDDASKVLEEIPNKIVRNKRRGSSNEEKTQEYAHASLESKCKETTGTLPSNKKKSRQKNNRVSKPRSQRKPKFSSHFDHFLSGSVVVYREDEGKKNDHPNDHFA